MKIGMIGAGVLNREIAALAVKNGHEVMISNSRDPQTLFSITLLIGCKAGTVENAAAFGDIVFIAIPFKNILSVPAQSLEGKIVIDANNYYPERDGHIAVLDNHETTTSEMLARHLSHSQIVKAFNAIRAKDLSTDELPAGTAKRRALPIAGNDTKAKKIVADLINQFGYDVVDAGLLPEGWRFEHAKPAYCVPFDEQGLINALSIADRNIDMPEGSWR